MRREISFGSIEETYFFSGKHDENVRLLEDKLDIDITIRGQYLFINGDKDSEFLVNKVLDILVDQVRQGRMLTREDVMYVIRDVKNSPQLSLDDFKLTKIRIAKKSRPFIVPKTVGQRKYVAALQDYDLVFGLGPAGTGKTYLAMAMAINSLLTRRVQRIVLTRPAVEAGERLGFLPGSLEEKLNPYLRPLYDALYDMVEADAIDKYIDAGIIEVAPLAYMRGRTLNDAFIVLDEAQNCTPEQMKMFLTRLGFGSKAVVTGDLTQSDLIGGKPIGLSEAVKILEGVKGIAFVHLTRADVVRHELVQAIIEAYTQYQKKTIIS